MPSDYESLRKILEPHGQLHLLHFWSKLSETEQRSLASEIREIDVPRSMELFRLAVSSETRKDCESLSSRMLPPSAHACGAVNQCTPEELAGLRRKGLELIAEGKVAALLLAGGQGTRLGVSYPKGMYDVGLPSHKSLYQIQAERIRRLQYCSEQLSGHAATIPWYIMTSEHTREPTMQFLSERGYFGLDASQVFVFEQAMLPCFSDDGKILMESPSRIARAPDGNGGLFRALRDNGVIQDMTRRGLEYVHVYAVDNILVRPADPVFLGYCARQNVECGAKVVIKAYPTEPVGVICQVDGRYSVVEYSELTLDMAEQQSPDGRLVYGLGNICMHMFSVPFLQRVCLAPNAGVTEGLKLHVARKNIPVVDLDSGKSIAPSKPNGIKIEKFVFDVFPLAKSFACWEVRREDEFAPIKNRPGAQADTPETARQALLSYYQRLVTSAGGTFVDSDGCQVDSSVEASSVICEISPLISYSGEDLEVLVAGKRFKSPVLLKHPKETAVTNNVDHKNHLNNDLNISTKDKNSHL